MYRVVVVEAEAEAEAIVPAVYLVWSGQTGTAQLLAVRLQGVGEQDFHWHGGCACACEVEEAVDCVAAAGLAHRLKA